MGKGQGLKVKVALQRCHQRSFSDPNHGIDQNFPLALSFLMCFHRELLEIPLGFSFADHLALMPSPLVSMSSPIGEVPNDFHFSLLLLLLFFYFIFAFKASGHHFTVAALRRQIEPPPLNNHGTLIVASSHCVQCLDHLDLSTVA
uniref:Uncharacterized protein n=1 Tax=Gossypium raimondii TaxID=29730 RepID=A0A0D2UDF3_GOSRA|nr:hypothetical protein B456_010G161600 [Gossypium raimondii]